MAALPIKEEAKPVKQIGTLRKLSELPNIDLPKEADDRMNAEDEKVFNSIIKHFGNRMNDVYYETIMRFVYGYAHETERTKMTIEKLEHYLQRFDEFDFKHILDAPMEDEENCFNSWPVYMYGYDKQGHPVMYDEICSSTVEKVKKVFASTGQVDFQKLRRYRFRFLRRLEQTKFLQSERYGKRITKHIMIMDMKSFTHKHLYQQMRHLVRDVIDDESNLFPDTLYRMYIVNAPLPFRLAWKIVTNFIHPITVEKIQILGTDFIKKVSRDIDVDQLPPSYKGKGKWSIKKGYVADIDNDVVDAFNSSETLKQRFLEADKDDNDNENDNEDDSKENPNDNTNANTNNNEQNGSDNNSKQANESVSDARQAESMSSMKVTG